MKKIPCLFQREFQGKNKAILLDAVTPGCEWVLAGEGVATRKWDGTACLVKDGQLFKRYDAKHGKPTPVGFIPAQEKADEVTGHFPGWVPVVEGDPGSKYHLETFLYEKSYVTDDWTYELVGPKFQGNPENLPKHLLVRHAGYLILGVERTFEGIRQFLSESAVEGIVFWRNPENPDSDMAKIRRKDYGLPWPVVGRQV